MVKQPRSPRTVLQYRERHSRLAATLTEIGFIWPGTVQRQTLTCGKPQCRCHKDPDARHGPYWYWTSKKKGKTISRKLTREEAEIIESWIENRRRIERTLKEMTRTSKGVLPLLLRERLNRD